MNAAGLDLVKRNEGLRLEAYQDTGGHWTIGYGHTPAKPGQKISEAQATRFLADDLKTAEASVGTVAAKPTANQFAAMSSLAFNIGAAAFRTSTVLREHNRGRFAKAADGFLLFDKEHRNGKLVANRGLARRRREERALYLAA